MRFHKPLDHILGTKSRVAVLRHLVQDDREQSGREIAQAIGLSPKPLNEVLAQLADEGMLLRRNVGRTSLYRLNHHDHLVTSLLVPLFEGERRLLAQALSDVLKDLPGLLSAILYGSVARGEERPYSDIDLLIVTENGSEAAKEVLDDRTVSFMRRYGHFLSYILISAEQFRLDYQAGDGFLREVIRTGRVVAGQPLWEVLHGAS